MSSTKVSVASARGYDYEDVYAAVSAAVEMVGGIGAFVKPKDKVFIKINHLPPPSPAERCIVTHPVFAEAVINLMKQVSEDITVGDDIDTDEPDGFAVSGHRQVCDRAGVSLISLREEGFVRREYRGVVLNHSYIARAAVDADVIINLPKLKTHSLTVFTGAVKNMYGVLPGGVRHSYHAEHAGRRDFSQMLVDVYDMAKPHLNIMDGIMAMEGNGPAGGSPRLVGAVLAGADGVAVDSVAGRIIGLKVEDVRTTHYASLRGIGVARPEDIEILGESIDSISVPDFSHPAATNSTLVERAPRFLSGFVIDRFVDSKPHVVTDKCTGCAECQKVCPADAVTVIDEISRIDHDICIKCMCCHEVCRYDAIVPRKAFLGRAFDFIMNRMKRR